MNAVWQKITNKYKNKCYRCYKAIPPGVEVEWNPHSRKIRHLRCAHRAEINKALNSGRTRTGNRVKLVS